MVHMITRAEIPAFLPASFVKYREVSRLVMILLQRTGELLTYNPAESITKGVVGSTGMKIPIKPSSKEIVPPDISNILIILSFTLGGCVSKSPHYLQFNIRYFKIRDFLLFKIMIYEFG